MLAKTEYGTASDRPGLLIAHGLYGSARNWGAIAKRLSDTRRVIAVDMRNHGESPWFDDHDYHGMARDLAAVADGPMDVLGHSMGGKAAMVMALTRPESVRKLIVADIAPAAYSHSQQWAIDAMRSVDLSSVESRSDADERLARTVEDRGVRAFLLQSLDLRGRRWRLNLDALESAMPDITGFPRIDGRFDGPTLFLSGDESDYVRKEHRAAIDRLFPNARFARLKGAGHWLHADRPREFEGAVRAFLDTRDAG